MLKAAFQATARRAFWIVLLSAVLVAGGLWRLHSPDMMTNDTAQYLSVADNIAAGRGIATDLIYYDQHYAQGRIPASQTVFPPVYPAMVASLGLLGVDAAAAVLLINLTAFALVALLVFALARRCGSDDVLAASAAVGSLCFVVPWFIALVGKSEIVFTLAGLLTVYALSEGQRQRCAGGAGWLVAAGLLMGLTVSIRYQGIFLCMAVAGYYGWRLLHERSWRMLQNALWVGVPGIAIVAVLAARNLRLAGSLGGGPIDLMAGGAHSVGGVARKLYYELSTLSGVSVGGLADVQWTDWLALLLGLAAAAWLSVVALRRPRAARAGHVDPAVGLAAAYLLVSVLSLCGLAYFKSVGYLQERFLMPLIPIGLALLARSLSVHLAREPRPRRVAPLALLLAALAAGQINVFQQQWARHVSGSDFGHVRRVFSAPRGASTLGERLQASIDGQHPLFATNGQLVGAALRRPVLEPTPAFFTRRVWTARETRDVLGRYGVQYVLFLPPLFDAAAARNANQPIFIGLAAGQVPDWLQACAAGDGFRLYRVVGALPPGVPDACD